MNPEENLNTKEELSKVLHKEGELPSLRTYQGDVASFIQSKDKSVADLAIKNREQAEKKKEESKNATTPDPTILGNVQMVPGVKEPKQEPEDTDKPYTQRSTNFLISLLGIFLLVASVAVVSYLAYSNWKNAPVGVSGSDAILRAQNSVVVNSLESGPDNFYETVSYIKKNTDYKSGITHIEVLDASSKNSLSSMSFLEKMKFSTPPALFRNLDNKFMSGIYGDSGRVDFFFILEVKDYGIAFRDMLTWEDSMVKDFGPIINPSASTSTPVVDYSGYTFKDLIVKNKDTRAFSSKFGKVALIYTFLNPNTILITESENSLTGLVNAFASGDTVR